MTNHFIDVGANIGNTFTNFLCKTRDFDGWSIWCFEPSPRHFSQLEQRASEFRHRYDIHLIPCGMAGATGTRKFYLKDDPLGDSFEEQLASDHLTINQNTGFELIVPCLGVMDFLNQFLPQGNIVLKLDCEGLEYEILDNLDPSRVNKILVEWHNIGSPHQDKWHLINKFPQMEAWTL